MRISEKDGTGGIACHTWRDRWEVMGKRWGERFLSLTECTENAEGNHEWWCPEL